MKWADLMLSKLTLEKKIGQMICADIAGGYISDSDPRLEKWVRLARDNGVGMFVLYGGTPRDVAHLLNRLQREAALPILMAADVEAQEFRAFKLAIDAGVTFIMTEHIAVPSVTDGSRLPASVEKKLATGWIRDKLGFKGILTTDDLWYDQVINRFG
jgi:beta-glucosidase-like glycosyl hydrolase